MSQQSNIAFAKWLHANDPFLFAVAAKRVELEKQKAGQMSGVFDFIGDIDWAGIGSTVIDTVQKVAPTVIQYQAQAKALKLNMERAKAGQPPINVADYTPTVKIAPQITPETEQAINRVAQQAVATTGDQLAKYLPWIGGGVLALVLLMRR